MTALIEQAAPSTWQNLEDSVARILAECGMNARVQHEVVTARGHVNADVYAVDGTVSPPVSIIVECKHWRKRVPKNVVHGLRTVLSDSGVNLGFLVSTAGFQEGAKEAAVHSNLHLVDWSEFQRMFVDRWFRRYMVPRLMRESEALIEYTESINSRIFRQADKLSNSKRRQFKTLRDKHGRLGWFLTVWTIDGFFGDGPPDLPLGATSGLGLLGRTAPNDEVGSAVDFRSLLAVTLRQAREAISEFDEVFGGRA